MYYFILSNFKSTYIFSDDYAILTWRKLRKSNNSYQNMLKKAFERDGINGLRIKIRSLTLRQKAVLRALAFLKHFAHDIDGTRYIRV